MLPHSLHQLLTYPYLARSLQWTPLFSTSSCFLNLKSLWKLKHSFYLILWKPFSELYSSLHTCYYICMLLTVLCDKFLCQVQYLVHKNCFINVEFMNKLMNKDQAYSIFSHLFQFSLLSQILFCFPINICFQFKLRSVPMLEAEKGVSESQDLIPLRTSPVSLPE